jgi:hypothetical protein
MQLLIEKGFLTKQEFFTRLKQVQANYQAKRSGYCQYQIANKALKHDRIKAPPGGDGILHLFFPLLLRPF